MLGAHSAQPPALLVLASAAGAAVALLMMMSSLLCYVLCVRLSSQVLARGPRVLEGSRRLGPLLCDCRPRHGFYPQHAPGYYRTDP